MAKKLVYTTNTAGATTDYAAADGTWKTIPGGGGGGSGTVTSVATTAPITGGTITTSGTIGITQATGSTDGYLSSANWNTFNNKQDAITLTTTGSGGSATLVGSTLNIPQYTSLAVLQAVYGGTTLSTGQIAYAAFENIGGVLTNENTRRVIMPVACTMSKFYTVSGSTQPATGSLTLTIRKNIADTILVITIAAGSIAGIYSNTSSIVSFAAGDAMAIKFVNNATSTSASIISVSSLLS